MYWKTIRYPSCHSFGEIFHLELRNRVFNINIKSVTGDFFKYRIENWIFSFTYKIPFSFLSEIKTQLCFVVRKIVPKLKTIYRWNNTIQIFSNMIGDYLKTFAYFQSNHRASHCNTISYLRSQKRKILWSGKFLTVLRHIQI